MTRPAAPRSDIEALARFALRVLGKTALVLALPALLTGFYVHRLRTVGELLPAATIARLSLGAERIIWLTGYYDTGFLHKLDVAREIKPTLAVVGSSRAMQIRSEFFSRLPKAEFYNLGGCCLSILDVQRTMRSLIALGDRRPKTVLLVVDPWWFQTRSNQRPRLYRLFGPLGRWAAATRTSVGEALSGDADKVQTVQRAWRDDRFRAALGVPVPRDTAVDALLVGIGARSSRSGFRNDGSFRYGALIAAKEMLPTDSVQLAMRRREFDNATIADILARGGTRGPFIVDDFVNVFEAVIREAQAAGVQLIAFTVPIAPRGMEFFDSIPDTRAYTPRFLDAIGGLCARYNVPYLNDFDGRAVGAMNDDFYEWLHPSERLIAREVLHLLADPAAAALLRPYADPATIEADLARSTHRWQLRDF